MYSHCVPVYRFWGTQIDAMCGTHPKQVRQELFKKNTYLFKYEI